MGRGYLGYITLLRRLLEFIFLTTDATTEIVPTAAVSIRRMVDQDMTDMMICLLYTSPSPRDQRGSRMPSSA